MNWLLYFLITVIAVFLGVSIYSWMKAEWDERQWRKIIDEEMSMPRFTYRMVREDDGSERE